MNYIMLSRNVVVKRLSALVSNSLKPFEPSDETANLTSKVFLRKMDVAGQLYLYKISFIVPSSF